LVGWWLVIAGHDFTCVGDEIFALLPRIPKFAGNFAKAPPGAAQKLRELGMAQATYPNPLHNSKNH